MNHFSPKKILVPVDFSSFSLEALKTAVDIAKKEDGELVVLYVIENPTPPPGYGQASVVSKNLEQLRGELHEESNHELEAMLKEAEAPLNVEKICTWGNPAHEIINMAENGDFDLIVLSTHGRTGLGRFLMGSVAERIIRHVSRPVLLIRGKK
jgi:nucleotide-binding universal stress UspA family protein